MIEINQDILKKAEEIIAERKRKNDYLEHCRTAGICPKCGEVLVLDTKEHRDCDGDRLQYIICPTHGRDWIEEGENTWLRRSYQMNRN